MRAIIQRVTRASVTVNSNQVGAIGPGIMLLLGVHRDDTEEDISWLAKKAVNLRIFEDNNGKMNDSLLDTGGSMLIVSQFTLYGDCRKGRRPGYSAAAPPDMANDLYLKFIDTVQQLGVKTAAGTFQAMMDVEIVNNGPVTLILDSQS